MDNYDEFLKDLAEAYQVVLLTTWPREKVWEWIRSCTITGPAPVIVWNCRVKKSLKGEESACTSKM